jgi:hypothetical protein
MTLQALVFPIPQLRYVTAPTTLRGGDFEKTRKWNSRKLTGGPSNTVFYMNLLASLAHDSLTTHLSPNTREQLPKLRADAFWQRLVLLRTRKSNPLKETPLGRKTRLLHPDLDPQEPLIFIGVDEHLSAHHILETVTNLPDFVVCTQPTLVFL